MLESLTVQSGEVAFEVIIVDQNGDGRLDEAIARFHSRMTLTHAKVAFQGASRARNHGANLARGRWIGFPDDDCELRPDTLAKMREAVITGEVPVVSGRTVDESGMASVLRWGAIPERFDRWTMFRCITECTLFVEATLFSSVGGFDPDFGPGGSYPAAEGIDIVNRLLGRNGQGFFFPEIEFVHASKVPPWNEWAVERFGRYAIGDGALIAKSPSLPMLCWGARTVVSALRHLVGSRDRLKRAAYLARLRGLAIGVANYRRHQT